MLRACVRTLPLWRCVFTLRACVRTLPSWRCVFTLHACVGCAGKAPSASACSQALACVANMTSAVDLFGAKFPIEATAWVVSGVGPDLYSGERDGGGGGFTRAVFSVARLLPRCIKCFVLCALCLYESCALLPTLFAQAPSRSGVCRVCVECVLGVRCV
jgi:hypothetical protein